MKKEIKLSKTDKTDLKRNEIVESFYGLVIKDGLENASMAKIANVIGIPSSLIFHYFKNKQELIYSLIDYALEICEGECKLPLKEKKSGKGNFEDYIDFLLKNLSASNKEATLVYFACRNLAFRDEVAFEKFRIHEEISIQRTESDLLEFIARGEIIHENPIVGAGYLCAIFNGIEFLADFADGTQMLEQMKQEHKRKILEYFKYKG